MIKKLNFYVIVSILALFASVNNSFSTISTRVNDSLELVDLYNQTAGSTKWLNRKGWLDSSSALYKWNGVTIGNIITGTDTLIVVKKLDLSNNNLTGTLKNLDLPDLEYLYLGGNSLSGNLPSFSFMLKLKELVLSHNGFNSNLQSFYLPLLTTLDLSKNLLRGAVQKFDSLYSLKILNLDSNRLTGTIPKFSISSLLSIHLSSNQLNGTIPAFNLPKLQDITLSGNQITGGVPSFTTQSLLRIQLSNNRLSGSIPALNLPNLKELSLASNQLTGQIPDFILPRLEFLNLDNNNLSGDIPFFNFPYLQSFSMKNNKLSGALPNYNFPNVGGINLDNNLLVDLPVLSSINPTTLLSVRNNKLTFEDIESNILISKFYYDGQDTIIPLDVTSLPRKTILNVLAAGKYNTYQWQKDDSVIAGATDTIYNATEDGTYQCIINNSIAQDLTLYSEKRAIVIDTTDTSAVHDYNLDFLIYDNTPNPFSNTTMIRFLLQNNGKVSVDLYDGLGTKITNLFDGYQVEGLHEIKFEPSIYGLTSGIYFYSIKVSGKIITKPMVYIK